MNLIAIDASTKSSGIAIYKHDKLQKYDCIKATSSDLFNRIKVMVKAIGQYLTENPDIDHLVLQQVRQDGFTNIKTYKALMYLQGCIMLLVHQSFKHVTVQFVYPSQWRKVCQIKQGRGIKRDIQKQNDINWVKKIFNIEVNDDIADAIGIGYAHIHK